MSGHNPPAVLSETVSPVKVTLPAGKLHHTERITLTNSGHSAFTVHAGTAVLSSSCHVSQAPSWVTVTPAAAVVAPGHKVNAKLVVHAPAGTHGTYDLAAVFTATGSGNGNARVSGAVASQVVIHSGTAGATCAGQHHQPVAAAASSSSAVPAVALVVAVVLLFAVIAAAAIRMRRHRGGGHRAA